MHLSETENHWSYSQSFNMTVDFCVWALEHDGLQTPPFNAHPDGNNILRKAGLQPSEWRSWIARVVELQNQQSLLLEQTAGTNRGQLAIPVFLEDANDPVTAYPAGTLVRDQLHTMWEQYRSFTKERQKWKKLLIQQQRQNDLNQQLWNDLQSYKSRLPGLSIYLVRYPQPVESLLPPASGILTLHSPHFDYKTFRNRVFQIADQLSLNS